MSGAKIETDTLLLAIIADTVIGIRWMLSEDGSKGLNRPESILSALLGEEPDVVGFDSGEAFEAARRKIIEEMNDG